MSQQEKHPPGLYVLFFTEMWERFGFYTMGAMFAAYLRDEKRGFGWSDANAQILTSVYLALVYASPLAGGFIADRKLGYRNSVLLGGVIFTVGYLIFGFPNILMVFAALACLILGNGFFKPNVSAMVGHQYPEGSPLKDQAFNIFYMGINIGAFFAPLVADFVSSRWGFRPAFMVASVGMVISVTTLWVFRHYVHEGAMRTPTPPPTEEPQTAAVTTDAPPPPAPPTNPIDAVSDARRIGALIAVFLIVIVFWMVFHQNSSTLVFWAIDNTDWTGLDELTGQKSSGILANAINPFFVVAFTFPLVWFWKRLNEKKLEPSTPTKIALGMFLTAASFYLLWLAAKVGEGEQVRPEMYAAGDFRVTEFVLTELKADGVPDDTLKKLAESKGKDNKSIVLNRKFSSDEKFSEALETIKQNLRSEGVAKSTWELIDETKDWADSLQEEKLLAAALAAVAQELKAADVPDTTLQPLMKKYKDNPFAAALAVVIQHLKAAGAPDDVLQRLEKYKDKKFTGDVKLRDAVERAIGPEATTKYFPQIAKHAFLYKVSPWWLILAYAIVTLGELMLSPMGLSLVSKVAPVRLRGLMMGGWFVATAIGNALTMIGVLWNEWLHSSFFALLGTMALVVAIVLVLLLRPLKKAMPGV
jgi:POT family proton-dependent oligopeptide transporter